MPETKEYIDLLIKKLFEAAKNKNINIEEGYLFGSYAKGNADEFSDIDLALVSKDFKGNKFLDSLELDEIILELTPKIKAHTFRPDEFSESNLFVKEILKSRIRVI